MRRNKIPAPLPFIFNLTSDFCGGRRRTIALRFPPKAEFAQSHGAQPSMINCEQLLCEQRGPLLVFIPLARLNTGELLSAGSRQRLCVTRHFKWISTSCQTATARPFEQTESGQKKSEVELGKRDICPRLCSTSPLCSFIERAAEK